MQPSGFMRSTAREAAVLAVAAVGAYLFFIHGALYLQAGSGARPITLEGFLLVTAILYLFLRLLFMVAGLYSLGAKPKFQVCPQCGEILTGAPPEVPEAHTEHRASRRPTEKEVMAAVLLRKAIDDARRSAQKNLAGPPAEVVRVPGEVENAPLPVDEFERILRQLDTPRSSRSPDERRPKGPR